MNNNNHLGFEYYTNELLGKWLQDNTITEIAINRPYEVFVERNGKWTKEKVSSITFDSCRHLSNALAAFKKDKISNTKPILSCSLLSGERVQVVMPPACEKDTISITVRKPSQKRFSLNEYYEQGFFSDIRKYGQIKQIDEELINLYEQEHWMEFLALAIKKKKTIVVSGGTGSGKTTFMKTLVDLIDKNERLITIEDVFELGLINQPNHVHLFYPSEAKPGDIITASALLKCCMRMKPDRILLAEIRGAEAFDFVKAISSDHKGSITSCHAGSVDETFSQLADYTLSHPDGRGVPYEITLHKLKNTIDIIIQISGVTNRRIKEIYFKDMELI